MIGIESIRELGVGLRAFEVKLDRMAWVISSNVEIGFLYVSADDAIDAYAKAMEKIKNDLQATR